MVSNGQRTRSTKMGADKFAQNTPNTPKFICPNCLSKPKMLRWASVVREINQALSERNSYYAALYCQMKNVRYLLAFLEPIFLLISELVNYVTPRKI